MLRCLHQAEYDIAVKESQTPGRRLSVKVKEFDIRGAKIINEGARIRYTNSQTWHYFTVVRSFGLPIKISSTSEDELKSIYNGIAGFLEREAKRKHAAMVEKRERMSAMYKETYY